MEEPKQLVRFTVEFLKEDGELDHKSGVAIRVKDLSDPDEIMSTYFQGFNALVSHEIAKMMSLLSWEINKLKGENK